MKTMLWKELRENLKWAVLAFLCLILAEFYALSSGRQSYVENYREGTLCSSAFLLVTSFGCSVIGAALAAVQILPELRRDQWAALLHRPVSRSVIFFGKVFAGLILYFGATTLPFLACTAYVATPGQFASPLVPGMLVPGLSDVGLGLDFYFAGMLLCLHRGRWFGSRGAIALSLVAIFLLHLTIGWPFLLPLAAALVFLPAAWGAMVGNGALQTRNVAARAAFVVVVLAGAQTALLILAATLQFLPSKQATPGVNYTRFAITEDGQVFISSQRGDDSLVLTDLNGKIVTDPRYVGNSARNNFCEMLPLSWDLGKREALRDLYLGAFPRNSWNYIQVLDDGRGKEVWYLLLGQNYFVGYDKLSRRVVGICDADGFKPAGATPKPFPFRLRDSIIVFRSPHLYWSGTRLYALNCPDRGMITMDAPNDTIYGALGLSFGFLQDKPGETGVALRNGVRLFDAQGHPLLDIPYPHDPGTWSYLELGSNETGDRIYLESSPTPYPWWKPSNPEAPTAPVFLDEIDLHGNILHTYSRPSPRPPVAPVTWANRFVTFTFPFLPAAIEAIHSHLDQTGRLLPAETEGTLSVPHPSVQDRDLAVLFVVAVVLAAFAFFWARRTGFSPKQARRWAGFVFCFGLPGLLTFRLASDWPRRVPCSHCGALRSIAAAECPHCHRPWPSPPRTGSEIFDLEEVEA